MPQQHAASSRPAAGGQGGRRRKILVSAAAAIILLAIAALVSYPNPQREAPSYFTFDNQSYRFTSAALTLQQQEHGLMNSSVTSNTFELFVFDKPSIYPFWMKDTYSPLDIIWVNGSRVVYMVNATPCVDYSPDQSSCALYVPRANANYVIETQAGFVNRTGMKVGSSVYIH